MLYREEMILLHITAAQNALIIIDIFLKKCYEARIWCHTIWCYFPVLYQLSLSVILDTSPRNHQKIYICLLIKRQKTYVSHNIMSLHDLSLESFILLSVTLVPLLVIIICLFGIICYYCTATREENDEFCRYIYIESQPQHFPNNIQQGNPKDVNSKFDVW